MTTPAPRARIPGLTNISWLRTLPGSLRRWVDGGDCGAIDVSAKQRQRVDWARCIPFVALHLACLGPIWVGWSPVAVITAAVLYYLRMFGITGFYHRYFSHRAFRTSRQAQFIFAVIGASAVQRGPLWWAGHHRFHHRHADTEHDPHSPRHHGLLWSHMGWFTTQEGFRTRDENVTDLTGYPELRWLDRYDVVVPAIVAALLYMLGAVLERTAPGLGTSGPQMLVWGFVISTVALWHTTYTVNSLNHRLGSRRYNTRDDSRNNAVLALLTMGEGWHNNHHHYPGSARQGFYWWEIDMTWYLLRILEWAGVIWDLKPVPPKLRDAWRQYRAPAGS